MSVYKRGKVWWFKFVWRGEQIRESTKQGNQRVAEQIEAARRTELAKGEVGIRDRKPVPTLGAFAGENFLPFVEKQKKDKRRTVRFYQDQVARLKTFPRIWNKRLDEIEVADISALIGARQAVELKTSTINRELATVRRMFKLAMEWKTVTILLPAVKLLSGENQRERVVSIDEEKLYLEAAARLLKDFAVLELDCGLRPEEAHRLTWTHIRNGNVEVHTGKTKDARRSVPASPRVVEMLERRRMEQGSGGFVFPALTKTGHVDVSSLRKPHAAALVASKVEHFVMYSLRHTCLTRWAESGMDLFTLKKLAGHANIATTMRYIHMSDAQSRKSLEKVWAAQDGHNSGHSDKKPPQVEGV